MALTHSPSIVRDGLVLYLDAANPKSYPGSGTTWFDLSGNGYVGSIINSPNYNSSNNGFFEFDGANAAVSVNLTRDNNSFTYMSWFVYQGGSGERDIIDTFEDTSREWTRLNVRNGIHSFHVDNDGRKTILGGSNAEIGVWYCSAGTWNPTTGEMKLYVNGVLDAETSKAQTSTISGLSNLYIGKRSSGGSEYFNGNIAAVLTYNRALTETEITQNFEALRGRYGV